MNILKSYAIFLTTPYFKPLNNKKINLSQYNPLFFEGMFLKNILFKK